MSLLDDAAVAVLPSRDEAMPMFILEAMARRACVISTAVGGIPDVLSGGCGIVVQPASVDELAAALRAVTSADGERLHAADSGFDRFSARFSADAVYPRVESIWLAARRAPLPSEVARRRREILNRLCVVVAQSNPPDQFR